MKAVENAARHKHHVLGVYEESLPVEEELDLASDHVEGLVRAFVHVWGRPTPGRHDGFNHPNLTSRFGGGERHPVDVTVEPRHGSLPGRYSAGSRLWK